MSSDLRYLIGQESLTLRYSAVSVTPFGPSCIPSMDSVVFSLIMSVLRGLFTLDCLEIWVDVSSTASFRGLKLCQASVTASHPQARGQSGSCIGVD